MHVNKNQLLFYTDRVERVAVYSELNGKGYGTSYDINDISIIRVTSTYTFENSSQLNDLREATLFVS